MVHLPWINHGLTVVVLLWYTCHIRRQLYYSAKTWYSHVDTIVDYI